MALIVILVVHHKISRQEFLEELCLLVLNSFDDELVVAGHIEDGSAGSGVGQLNQWLITQRVLQAKEERANMVTRLDP